MRVRTLSFVVLASLATNIGHAEVFQNLPGQTASSRDAKTAYTGNVNINGGLAKLKVLSYSHNLRAVMNAFKQEYSDRQGGLFMNGRLMGLGVIQRGNTITRFLAVTPTTPNHTLVFRIEQSLSDYERSQRAPTRHLLTELPPPSSSKPSFYMKDKSTDMSVEISHSFMLPAEVHRNMSASLITQGWKPLVPLEQMRATPGLMIYIKGRELSMVSVSANRNTRQSTITLLHKTPALR